MLGNLGRKRSGDDGHHRHRFFGHGALFDPALADIVEKQNAHFVSADELIAAVGTLHGDTDTVRIRVCRQHQIGADLLGEFHAELHRFIDLRIGIRAGGEIAVGIFLFGNDRDVIDSHVLEDTGNRNKTGSVERRVNKLQAGGLAETRAYLMRFDRLIEGFLAFVFDKADQTLFHAFRKAHVLRAGQDIGLLNAVIYHGSGVIGHLTSVRAIGLEAVVLGGVVARCDHDAGVALIVSCRKAECRNGHQFVVNADIDSVGRKNACRISCEVPALETAVIADRYGLGSALGFDPVGDTLGCLTDHPDVHPVGAGAERSAQTCGSELKRDGEAFLDRFFIVFDVQKFRAQIDILKIRFEPSLVIIHVHNSSFLS